MLPRGCIFRLALSCGVRWMVGVEEGRMGLELELELVLDLDLDLDLGVG